MKIDNTFDIEELVYVKTDPEQHVRIVTGFYITQNEILYEVSIDNSVSKFYDFELTRDKTIF